MAVDSMIRAGNEKMMEKSPSASYNRSDPVDLDTFQSYIKRYRRSASPKQQQISTASTSSGPSRRPYLSMLGKARVAKLYRRTSVSGDGAAIKSFQEQLPTEYTHSEGEEAYSGSSSSSSNVSIDPPDYSPRKPTSSYVSNSSKKWTKIPSLKTKSHKDQVTKLAATMQAPGSPKCFKATKKLPDEREVYSEDLTRLHLERLSISNIFWETVFGSIYAIHTWKSPQNSTIAAIGYLYLWYYDLLGAFMFLYLAYYMLQYRLNPAFCEPIRKEIRSRILEWKETETILGRFRRGTRLDLLALHKHFVTHYGLGFQSVAGELADINERGENLILWRDPQATMRSVYTSLAISAVLFFTSAAVIWKSTLLLLGLFFFLSKPLVSYASEQFDVEFPSFWLLWFMNVLVFGAPTHAEYAAKLQA